MAAIIYALAFLFVSQSYIEFIIPSIKAYYVNAKIIMAEEYIFSRPWSFDMDCRIITHRQQWINPNTPPEEAYYSLPSSLHCWNNIAICDEFEAYIKSAYEFKHSGEQQTLDYILEDLKWRREVWYELSQVKTAYRDLDGPRLRMEHIINMVGKEVFYSGKWPNPLPDAGYNSIWEPVEILIP